MLASLPVLSKREGSQVSQPKKPEYYIFDSCSSWQLYFKFVLDDFEGIRCPLDQ